MKKEILCTIGPSSFNEWTLKRLENLGVSLFRINLSHTPLHDLPDQIKQIQSCSGVPICLDTEGAQIRTGFLREGSFSVREHSIIEIVQESVPGNPSRFNLYPRDVVTQLEVGDFLSIDFDSVLAQLIQKDGAKAQIKILNKGKIGSNKSVTVEREIALPPLTEKDIEAIDIATKLGIKHFALSFAHRASDVNELKKYISRDSTVISKIECHKALLNLTEIIEASDAILIDRGDLSREEPIERVPFLQKKIIQETQKQHKKTYVATNLLESMVKKPQPTRAEINDIYNTLLDGADGLVLAAETAIGVYPTQAVSMVIKVIHEFERSNQNDQSRDKTIDSFSLLVPSHGGALTEHIASAEQLKDSEKIKKIPLRDTDLIDAEQIALGTYSPLRGFMDEGELNAVLKSYHLTNGVVWTLPIVLQLEKKLAQDLKKGERIALTDTHGEIFSIMYVNDIYAPNLDEVAEQWFGTKSREHPGVDKLFSSGEYFLGGDVYLIKRKKSLFQEYELTPKQFRFLFNRKGWSRVVGFHSRNVVHRVHEHIQMKALEITHADGLLISPVIGLKKAGDFKTESILKSYQLMIDFGYYPEGKVMLGAFSTYSRYSGPREAVFTALCRKNMGCSHFIVGRDHTGTEGFYGSYESRNLFKKLGNIGIEPVFFDTIGFNAKTGQYEKLDNCKDVISISGTQARKSILNREKLPEWFMRGTIQDMLFSKLNSGQEVFHP